MLEIDPDILRRTDEELRERYSARLVQFGEDPRTLGWDSSANQLTRFSTASRCQPTSQKDVLDIGCGFSDLLRFLSEDPSRRPMHYTGVDINPELLKIGAQRYPNESFIQGNILLDEGIPRADVVFMLGLLNFRFAEFANIDYAKAMISRAFDLAREALVLDMLTLYSDAAYPKEEFVYYYDPSEMLAFALSVTPFVELHHDYPSIPQREMMLVLRRAPCTS